MKKNRIRLTFFGDSIFVGQGVSIYKSWINKIAERMDAYTRDKAFDILVTNSSVNGRTTRQALEDMPYHVQNNGADILVIQFGLNDCNYWATDRGLPRVSREAFIANIKEICMRGRTFGAARVLVNSSHPTTRNKVVLPNTDITYEDSNSAYCEALRRAFAGPGSEVMFQDLNAYFKEKYPSNDELEKILLEDELHLSELGHEEYFQVMHPIVMRQIADFARSKGWD